MAQVQQLRPCRPRRIVGGQQRRAAAADSSGPPPPKDSLDQTATTQLITTMVLSTANVFRLVAPSAGEARLRRSRSKNCTVAAAGSPAANSGSTSTLEDSLHRIFKGHDVERVVQSIRRNLNNQPQFRQEHPGMGLQEAHAYVEGTFAAGQASDS